MPGSAGGHEDTVGVSLMASLVKFSGIPSYSFCNWLSSTGGRKNQNPLMGGSSENCQTMILVIPSMVTKDRLA